MLNTPAVVAHPVVLRLKYHQFHEHGCRREGGGRTFRCGQLSIYTDNDSLQGLRLVWSKCTANRVREIIALRGKGLRNYSQGKNWSCFDFALVTAVCGSYFISVKRNLAGIHQRKSVYPFCFHWTWPSVYAKLLLFFYHQAKTFLRVCNLYSIQGD